VTQVKVKVLDCSPHSFFFKHRVPKAGEILTMDQDDAQGLAKRGLVEIIV
jgi:hypothetical protein